MNPAWSFPARPPEVRAAAQTDGLLPSRLVRWALYGFVFSLAFDAPGKFTLEITTLTGALFLLATLYQPHLCYGRWPGALVWFLAYLYVYAVAFVVGGGLRPGSALVTVVLMVEAILIFWAGCNLMRHEGVARAVVVTLVVACLILATMTLLGIGNEATPDELHRVSVLGQNPNRTARVLGAGLLGVVALSYSLSPSVLRPRLLAWPCAGLMLLAMLIGGSRGALLALAAGFWTFTIAGKNIRVKLRNALVALLALGFCIAATLQSPLMMRRFSMAEEGNLAQREKIFPTLWEMFLEKPLIGWGPNNKFELSERLHLSPQVYASRDTHNLVLEVLTGTGVAGAIPFFLGFGLCFWAAWRVRNGTRGILPFALTTAVLVGNMSGNFIAFKLTWLVLAYAVSGNGQHATSQVFQRVGRRFNSSHM